MEPYLSVIYADLIFEPPTNVYESFILRGCVTAQNRFNPEVFEIEELRSYIEYEINSELERFNARCEINDTKFDEMANSYNFKRSAKLTFLSKTGHCRFLLEHGQ